MVWPEEINGVFPMADFPDHAQLANLSIIESLYRQYEQDPNSVDPSWRHFFEGIDFASFLAKPLPQQKEEASPLRILLLIQSYRRHGHLLAKTNPLEDPPSSVPQLSLGSLGFAEEERTQEFPTLGLCGKQKAPLEEIIKALKEIYGSRIGIEYMDLGNLEMEKWIQERLEPSIPIALSADERILLLHRLNQSEVFETFLHSRYVGQTRFSLEGNETAIPLIAELLDRGASLGIKECWIGMAHRGRLNVLANILKKPYSSLFEEFEDDMSLSLFGNDDVKYHMGFSGTWDAKGGEKVLVGLPPNPSHLESVDPVLLGLVRAKQAMHKEKGAFSCVPIMIHGDAALAGQGVVYESLQLAKLADYTVGGTIHLVLNNQIGYTTLPNEGRSTRYCTDIAKAFGVPVFHVNAEDPESSLFAAKLAIEIRQKFQCDVFIDLIGYRKYGHNEGDEPSYTQPLQYEKIRSKKSIRNLYFETLASTGQADAALLQKMDAEYQEFLQEALSTAQKTKKNQPDIPENASTEPVQTHVEESLLRQITDEFCTVPAHFHLHPKLQKWVQERKKMDPIDWAFAEALSFGSLLAESIPIRLAGQDSRRGTFSQRHLIWIDVENGSTYCPLNQERKAQIEIVNSPLTEFAGMGFEYGYSYGHPRTLVLWEAQYGDFNNSAQVIIDQYIASAEQKWNVFSSLVLLLPHAYEGAGPEHSSARLERFLQLSALNNLRIAYPSTPAQYFHLLRRQALSKQKRPLVVLTPKGLLRAKAFMSRLSDFTKGAFFEVLADSVPSAQATRLLICSGKIFYDLLAKREEKKLSHVAIIRCEQLYPFPETQLKEAIFQYRGAKECFWVQEEPENMGAWSFISPILHKIVPKEIPLSYIGRKANATPATGSHKKHKQEQAELIEQALGTRI